MFVNQAYIYMKNMPVTRLRVNQSTTSVAFVQYAMKKN